VILPVEESSLAVEPVIREPLVVALPVGHRLASRRKIPLKALSGEDSILFPRALSPAYYDQIISVCRNSGFSLRIIHEMDNIYTALALVEAGLGVSLFPASIQGLRRTGVIFRELEAPFPKMQCAVVYRREGHSAVLDSFLDVVRQVSGGSRAMKAETGVSRRYSSN
jgi:DNA-binding transcriptional LysR family regulator